MDEHRKIYLSEKDMERLRNIVGERQQNKELQLLVDELDHAIVLPQEEMPPDVVTMNSKVLFEDVENKKSSEITVVYPQHADAANRKISILAPVGAALIGLSVGDTIEWPLPGGKKKTLRILKVLYQPESAGRLDL